MPAVTKSSCVDASPAPFKPIQGAHAAVAAGLADVRRHPNADAELVTQARLWTPARCLEEAAGWVRVRLPDYEGWVRDTDLGASGRPTRKVAVVVDGYVPIYANPTLRATFPVEGIAGVEGHEVALDVAWVGTVLPLARPRQPPHAGRLAVRLPGSGAGWVKRSAVVVRPRAQPFPSLGSAAVLALAYSLLGVPYLWGGTSLQGIDCSGLTQLCWRLGGATLPRDADQQYAAIPYLVERGDPQPGDLLFFAAHGCIDHVALSLGGDQFIHASGSSKRVVMSSFDSSADTYSPLLAHMYAGARRPMPDAVQARA